MCMPSIVATQSWIVMAHCFARPEYFTAAGGSLAQSPAQGHSKGRAGRSDGEEDDNLVEDPNLNTNDERCRIFRSISISINEGRGIGELGTEIARPTPKSSYDRKLDGDRDGSSSASASIEGFPLSTAGSDAPSPARAGAVRLHRVDGSREQSEGMDTFCEMSLDGDALARTSIRKGTTSPFWNESFVFSSVALS